MFNDPHIVMLMHRHLVAQRPHGRHDLRPPCRRRRWMRGRAARAAEAGR